MNEARIILPDKQRYALWSKNKYRCALQLQSNDGVILDRICAYKKECVVAHSSNVSKFHAIEVNVLSHSSDSICLECIVYYCRRTFVYTNISPNHIFCCDTHSPAQHSTVHIRIYRTLQHIILFAQGMLAMQFLALCNSSSIHFRLMVYQKCIPYACDTNIRARKFRIGQVPSDLLGQDEEVFQCWLTHKSYLHRAKYN